MSAAVAQPPLKTWTRAELDALDAAGLLAGTRFELIEGEIFDKMGQNPPHAAAVSILAAAVSEVFGATKVRTQSPVEPADAESARSLPHPDVAVTREPGPAYRSSHPGAADVLLIAEAADSTIDYDVKRKGRLCARAGFVEYIVIDLNERQLLVFRSPRGGVYTEIHVLRPGDVFHPLIAPGSEIEVVQLFGD